jgi:hypothetical protein
MIYSHSAKLVQDRKVNLARDTQFYSDWAASYRLDAPSQIATIVFQVIYGVALSLIFGIVALQGWLYYFAEYNLGWSSTLNHLAFICLQILLTATFIACVYRVLRAVWHQIIWRRIFSQLPESQILSAEVTYTVREKQRVVIDYTIHVPTQNYKTGKHVVTQASDDLMPVNLVVLFISDQMFTVL